MTHSIQGTVVLHTSAKSQCRCCEGPHVCGRSLALDHYESPFPAHWRRDVDHWLQSVLHFKNLVGQAIAITARVVA